MKILKPLTGYAIVLLAALALLVSLGTGSALALNLYIGDFGSFDNNTGIVIKPSSVKVVDLIGNTGTVSTFVSGSNPTIRGTEGLLFKGGNLLVANQNVFTQFNGEILSYKGPSGNPPGGFLSPLVPGSNPNAPFAPQGIILGKQATGPLFVANITSGDGPNGPLPGTINSYNANSGVFMSALSAPQGFPSDQFFPRSLVFGPDGLLYVSTIKASSAVGGWVLRYQLNPNGSLSFVDQFIRDPSGVGHLNRPNGLVFGPDGNLYITSFRAGTDDIDSIRIYNSAGVQVNHIDLDRPGGNRSRANALLFGPDGNLFVPIDVVDDQGNQLPGELRSYDINHNNAETDYTLSGEELVFPIYSTFTNTDPSTLNYAPMPGTIILLGSGLLGLVGLRRRVRS